MKKHARNNNSVSPVDLFRGIYEGALSVCKEDGDRVRAEDLLSTLASAVGEGVFYEAGFFHDESFNKLPGTTHFSDAANEILSGNQTDLSKLPTSSVFAILLSTAKNAGYKTEAAPKLEDVYKYYASNLCSGRWGYVPVNVPVGHMPYKPPVMTAYFLRPLVKDSAERFVGEAPSGRRILATYAAVMGLYNTKNILAPDIALQIVFDTINGMSKTTPLTQGNMNVYKRIKAAGLTW